MISMMSRINISVPLIGVLKSYDMKWMRNDAIAGTTMAAVAVPQAMAYTQLAHIPLAAGLYTALVAMILFAFFTTSRYANVGPDAAMAALTGAVIAPLAIGGDPSRFMFLAAALAILIGIVCIIAVYARLSILAEFISRPILLGYMSGLALVVIASQLPKLFGMESPVQTGFFSTITYIIAHLGSTHLVTFVIGVLLIGVVLLLQRYAKKVPVSIVVLVGMVFVSWLFSLSTIGVPVVGEVPTGLPTPIWPTVSLSDLQSLVVPALMIALVSYANTISTSRAFAHAQTESVETPQEVFGLGAANIGSGFFGGMSVAASGTRTAVNYKSRAVTQVSQLFGALFIVVVLIALAPALSYLPQTALAVIIIMAVMSLFNLRELKSIWHAWRSEAVLAIITLVGVTLLGIMQGLLLAVLLAAGNFMRKNTIPKYVVMGLAEDGKVRDMSRPPKTIPIPGMVIFRFDAPLYFMNANYFKDTVYKLIENSKEPVQWVVWDAETVTHIDSTAGQMLVVLMRDLKKRNITFAVARMKGPVRSVASKSRRLSRLISRTPHFATLGEAVHVYKSLLDNADK